MSQKSCRYGKTWPTKLQALQANPHSRVRRCNCCKQWRVDNTTRKGDKTKRRMN